MSVLGVRDLTVRYGAVVALDRVTLEAAGGKITAVLGANGAGKTTLLRAISGLVRTAGGSVTFGGQELSRLAPEAVVRSGVTHVPAGRGVIGELTVGENLILGGLWRRDRKQRKADIKRMYEIFPSLARRQRQRAAALSGGERQMLSLARGLMSRPSVLLLDEPSLGLAPKVTTQILHAVRDLNESDGLTVLIAEQNARSALSIAHQVVVFTLGRVATEGPVASMDIDAEVRHHYLGF